MRSEISVACDMIAIGAAQANLRKLNLLATNEISLALAKASCCLLLPSCGSWLYAKALADLCGDDEWFELRHRRRYPPRILGDRLVGDPEASLY